MILQRLFRFSSALQSAVSVYLRRNIGVTAVAFKELDPVQKLFVDKIREYKTKRQVPKTFTELIPGIEVHQCVKGRRQDPVPNLSFLYGLQGRIPLNAGSDMTDTEEFVQRIKSSGGPVDTGPEYQQDLERELFKLKQMFGKADMNAFPDFKFEDPKFEVIDKPPS